MNDRSYKELINNYSDLFLHPDKIEINFEYGWYGIISELFSTIEVYFGLYPDKDFSNFKIISIKKKFGVLMIETQNSTDVLDVITSAAEILTYKTCEECGKIGDIYCDTKWLHWSEKKILCKSHAVELFYYSISPKPPKK